MTEALLSPGRSIACIEPLRGIERVRAVVHDRYGPPDVPRLEEVERPVPKDDEVLVKIHATTVNRTDCDRRAADSFLWRLFAGLRRPKRRILGSELAGEVEAVRAAVTEFAVAIGPAPLVRQGTTVSGWSRPHFHSERS